MIAESLIVVNSYFKWVTGKWTRMRVRKVRLVFDPSGSPLERGEGNREDPLTFRLALNEE